MTVVIQCRRCFAEYEVDVLQLAGQWWRRCPHCDSETDGETTDVDANKDMEASE